MTSLYLYACARTCLCVRKGWGRSKKKKKQAKLRYFKDLNFLRDRALKLKLILRNLDLPHLKYFCTHLQTLNTLLFRHFIFWYYRATIRNKKVTCKHRARHKRTGRVCTDLLLVRSMTICLNI